MKRAWINPHPRLNKHRLIILVFKWLWNKHVYFCFHIVLINILILPNIPWFVLHPQKQNNEIISFVERQTLRSNANTCLLSGTSCESECVCYLSISARWQQCITGHMIVISIAYVSSIIWLEFHNRSITLQWTPSTSRKITTIKHCIIMKINTFLFAEVIKLKVQQKMIRLFSLDDGLNDRQW